MLQRKHSPIVLFTLLIGLVAMQSRAMANTEIIRIKAGAIACDLPAGWLAVDGDRSGHMQVVLQRDADQMVGAMSKYHRSGEDTNNNYGVRDFTAAHMRGLRGYVRAYTFHLLPQQDYYTTGQASNHINIEAMEKQNTLTKASDNGTVMVGDREFLKLDVTFADQRRLVSMAYWNVTNPDLVSQIDFILLPHATDADRQTMDEVLSSIQTRVVGQSNAHIGQFSMHVPNGWAELSSAGNLPDALANRVRAYANASAEASPDEVKLYHDGSGGHINAWTMTLNQGKDFLQTVYSTQSARLESERANLKRGTCRIGEIDGMQVLRVFKEYNNGDRRTTYLKWKWFSLGDAYQRTSFMSAVEVNVSAPTPQSKDIAVLDSISYNTPPRAAVPVD